MGATNCPETPRQRMITMMYLVYTAMLALNVSAEVISGFKSVGTAMRKSNENIVEKLDDTYINFEAAYKNSPDKVGEKYTKAMEVKALSSNLVGYIDSLECEFIARFVAHKASIKRDTADKKEVTIPLLDAEKNVLYDSVRYVMNKAGLSWFTDKQLEDNHNPANFFYKTDKDAAEGSLTRANIIRQRIVDYKYAINKALGEDSNQVHLALDVSGGKDKDGKDASWEQLNFNEVITGAALVTLTKIKAEALNAEFDAVNMLYKQVSKGDFSFDEVAIISRPKSTYIIQGGMFETRFNVAAYDSRQGFKATIGGREYESADSGSIKYTVQCNTVGQQTVRGTAVVKNPEGGDKIIEFSESYFVAKPVGVVSLDNMQVLYSGIDNPISVGVPGVDSRNVKPVILEGKASIRQVEGDGKYMIVPEVGCKSVLLAVDALLDKGKGMQRMNTIKYKVREIPKPEIIVGGNSNGAQVSKKDLASNNVVKAVKNEGFVFDVGKGSSAYRVKKISVGIGARDYNGDGSTLPPDAVSAIRKADRGTKVYVTADVQMPDGTTKQSNCTLTLK